MSFSRPTGSPGSAYNRPFTAQGEAVSPITIKAEAAFTTSNKNTPTKDENSYFTPSAKAVLSRDAEIEVPHRSRRQSSFSKVWSRSSLFSSHDTATSPPNTRPFSRSLLHSRRPNLSHSVSSLLKRTFTTSSRNRFQTRTNDGRSAYYHPTIDASFHPPPESPPLKSNNLPPASDFVTPRYRIKNGVLVNISSIGSTVYAHKAVEEAEETMMPSTSSTPAATHICRCGVCGQYLQTDDGTHTQIMRGARTRPTYGLDRSATSTARTSLSTADRQAMSHRMRSVSASSSAELSDVFFDPQSELRSSDTPWPFASRAVAESYNTMADTDADDERSQYKDDETKYNSKPRAFSLQDQEKQKQSQPAMVLLPKNKALQEDELTTVSLAEHNFQNTHMQPDYTSDDADEYDWENAEIGIATMVPMQRVKAKLITIEKKKQSQSVNNTKQSSSVLEPERRTPINLTRRNDRTTQVQPYYISDDDDEYDCDNAEIGIATTVPMQRVKAKLITVEKKKQSQPVDNLQQKSKVSKPEQLTPINLTRRKDRKTYMQPHYTSDDADEYDYENAEIGTATMVPMQRATPRLVDIKGKSRGSD